MRLGARLFTALTTNPGVSGIVSTRVHPEVAPQGEAPPFLVYSVPHAAPLVTFDGPDTTREVLIQFSCFSRHYDDAQALADAVEAWIATRQGPGLALADGPIFGSVTRRALPPETQPQWYHVAVDARCHTLDT